MERKLSRVLGKGFLKITGNWVEQKYHRGQRKLKASVSMAYFECGREKQPLISRANLDKVLVFSC